MDKRYNLDYIKKQEWFKIVRRDNSAFFESFLRVASATKNSKLKFNNVLSHHLVLDHDVYAAKNEFEKLKKRMARFADKDKNFIPNYFNEAEKDCYDYVKFIKKIKNECNNDNLLKLFSSYIKETLKVLSHLWPPLGIENYILNKIEAGLARKIDLKNNFNEFNSVFQVLLSSEFLSLTQKRRQAILSLALKIKNKKIKEDSIIIQNEYKKYCWIDDHGIKLVFETRKHFMDEIKKTVKNNPKASLNDFKKERKEVRGNRNKVIKKYKLNKDIIFWANQAGKLPYIRFLRIETVAEGSYILNDFLFKLICEKLKIKKLVNLYYQEIYTALKSGYVNKKYLSRSGGYSFIVVNKYFYEFSRKEVLKIKNLIEVKEIAVREIAGSIACPGKRRGIVKVLFSPKENKKIKKGEILATSMTTPDYIQSMKKATAFITDEGGISCHAAIVAREMKKPCIIGTKIATKVLHDGDLVEVDADKGIVRIIKKINGI